MISLRTRSRLLGGAALATAGSLIPEGVELHTHGYFLPLLLATGAVSMVTGWRAISMSDLESWCRHVTDSRVGPPRPRYGFGIWVAEKIPHADAGGGVLELRAANYVWTFDRWSENATAQKPAEIEACCSRWPADSSVEAVAEAWVELQHAVASVNERTWQEQVEAAAQHDKGARQLAELLD